MTKQPYIYSMPESFLKDTSVPARWRVLAVINGFILNGGCFYGSNEWLMGELSCSQHTISTAFTELEDLQEIRTERTRRTRKVYKTSRDSNQLLSQIAAEHAGDSSQLLPTSVSNSVKETTGSLRLPDSLEIEEVPDSDTPSKTPKDDYVAEYREMCDWSIKRRGFGFTALTKQYAALKKARKLGIGPNKLKERWIELESEEWRDGFDWTSVVSSFDKRA